MDFNAIVGRMVMLFILLVVGYLARKLKVLTADGNKMLSRLITGITLPATILSSVLGGDVGLTGREAIVFFGLCLLAYAVQLAVAHVTPFVLGVPKRSRGLYVFMTAFANVGFMGYPVIQAVYGQSGMFSAALFNIVFNVLAYSLAPLYLSEKKEKINLKLIFNPAVIATGISILIFATNTAEYVPTPVVDAVDSIGAMTTPAAMLIVGSALASVPVKEVFDQWRLYPMTLVRLLVVPVLVWLAVRPFASGMLLGVIMILSAMPVASAATFLSVQYGGDEKTAAKGVFITTLLSVLSVPALIWLLL